MSCSLVKTPWKQNITKTTFIELPRYRETGSKEFTTTFVPMMYKTCSYDIIYQVQEGLTSKTILLGSDGQEIKDAISCTIRQIQNVTMLRVKFNICTTECENFRLCIVLYRNGNRIGSFVSPSFLISSKRDREEAVVPETSPRPKKLEKPEKICPSPICNMN
jgi:hypothetical protein